jgi:hypothetical protein
VSAVIALNLLIVLWLMIVIPGLIYSVRILHRSIAAYYWLRDNKLNGYRRIVARGAIHRGRIRVLISVCMVLMGLLAGATQFFEPGSDSRAVISGMFRLIFILMALAFSYKSYLEQHELDLLVNEDQRRSARTRSTDQEPV